LFGRNQFMFVHVGIQLWTAAFSNILLIVGKTVIGR